MPRWEILTIQMGRCTAQTCTDHIQALLYTRIHGDWWKWWWVSAFVGVSGVDKQYFTEDQWEVVCTAGI